jgi:hypothetical protein
VGQPVPPWVGLFFRIARARTKGKEKVIALSVVRSPSSVVRTHPRRISGPDGSPRLYEPIITDQSRGTNRLGKLTPDNHVLPNRLQDQTTCPMMSWGLRSLYSMGINGNSLPFC